MATAGAEPRPSARGRLPRTLRLRLTLVTAGVLALALTAGAVLLVQLLQQGRIQALDDAATARVTTVADLVTTDRLPDALGVAQPGEVVQLLAVDGRVVASSSNASLTLPVVSGEVLADLVARAGKVAPAGDPVLATAPSAYAGQARMAALLVAAPGDVAAEDVLVVAALPLGDVTATVRALGLSLAAAVPLLVLGLGALVWLVLGRTLRPVEELRVAADAVVAAGGPGSLPVPPSGELAALATTLNQMLDRLDDAVASERAAADTARAAAARQRSFVADAAHELRSPLASLGTALDVATAHPDAYPRDELVADLSADVARMQTLVEDLLLLARLGTRPLAREELDLAEVAARAAGPASAASGDTIIAVAGHGTATGDAGATERILRNLVENAVRHARAEIAVGVSPGRWSSTTTAPASPRPSASGCSSGSCGSTRPASATAAGRGSGLLSPGSWRASRAATSPWRSRRRAVCGPCCGFRPDAGGYQEPSATSRRCTPGQGSVRSRECVSTSKRSPS
ncbi:two-component sensor histidine kinase [Serinibacter arcticus]|uniref:histidine kinase n=1 Tax=Serinibacter arcticus TaxID=1655435 RepID=A0A2U1ZUY5_9MICO|nr:two-component sensor histidine kinase [Serinibacter arcticus]